MTQPRPLPIVCDMTDAPDTPVERITEYEQLFATALVSRERTESGIRFRFRQQQGLAARVADLAAREQACCAFFTFDIGLRGDELWWDVAVIDDPVARQILDEFYELPHTVVAGPVALHERFAERGLDVVIDDNGLRRAAEPSDLGFATPATEPDAATRPAPERPQ